MHRYLRLIGSSGTLCRAEIITGNGGGRISAELESPAVSRLIIVTPEFEAYDIGGFSHGRTRISADYTGKAAFVALASDEGLLAFAPLYEGADAARLESLFAPPEAETEPEEKEQTAESVSEEQTYESVIAPEQLDNESIIAPTLSISDTETALAPVTAPAPEIIPELPPVIEPAAPLPPEPASFPLDESVPVSFLPTLSFPQGFESIGSLISTEYGIGVQGREGWRFCRLRENPEYALGVKLSGGEATAIECFKLSKPENSGLTSSL